MRTIHLKPLAALAALFLTLALANPSPSQDSADLEYPSSTEGWKMTLVWADSGDTGSVRVLSPDQPIRIRALLASADSIQGFRLGIRVSHRGEEGDSSWSFADYGDCKSASLRAVADGIEGMPAPWQEKRILFDSRAKDDSTSVLDVAAAFVGIVLSPDSTYTLCELELKPPSSKSGACSGWGNDAMLELAEATILDAWNQEIAVENLNTRLFVRFE
jgi:hypothetical protein